MNSMKITELLHKLGATIRPSEIHRPPYGNMSDLEDLGSHLVSFYFTLAFSDGRAPQLRGSVFKHTAQ